MTNEDNHQKVRGALVGKPIISRRGFLKTAGAVIGLSALDGCVRSPEKIAETNVKKHPIIEGVVDNFPVKISFNEDESWRFIRIESSDGKYVEAEDYTTDRDGFFNEYSHNLGPSGEGINHLLKKYTNQMTLREVYQHVREQNGETQ